jgi:hypothetical protein
MDFGSWGGGRGGLPWYQCGRQSTQVLSILGKFFVDFSTSKIRIKKKVFFLCKIDYFFKKLEKKLYNKIG